MAYNELLADRIRIALKGNGTHFEERKMFGGICFMVNDKMYIGIIQQNLMARIDPKKEKEFLGEDGCRPMDFTKRPMNGYLYVSPESVDMEADLNKWVKRCLEFNPKAKSSKKIK